MNVPKVSDSDYIQFLIAAQRVYTCTEAAQCATMLDKPQAQKMGLVTRQWSGKHHAVVQGINLTTLHWTDGHRRLLCACRLYEPAAEGEEQVTKNDHFLAMLQTAKARGFHPRYVCFDSWYSSLENLKELRKPESDQKL